MAELLLELLSEEIPARMQDRAREDLARLVAEALAGAGLAFDPHVRSFATPRRLTVAVAGLPARQEDRIVERKGPRADAPEQARAGFLRALASLDHELVEREEKKGRVVYALVREKGRATADLLAELLPPAIARLPWPRSMRWGSGDFRWVRPLQSILCLLDGEVVRFAVGGVEAGDRTRGHRFLAPEPFAVRDLADYVVRLRAAKVILDGTERRGLIARGAAELAAAHGLAVADDPALLEEVKGLVEWPVPLLGAIDAAFMELPPEVLVTTMRANQKYLALCEPDGSLARRFVVVANTVASDGGAAIVAGNERVLRARLWDARFFWDQDRKVPLESRLPRLDAMVFHADLGTMLAKTQRIVALSKWLVDLLPPFESWREPASRAALLCKADLVTGMVSEFPELQGTIGYYLAQNDGEALSVATAIKEHYSPEGPDDHCPRDPCSITVSLADKINTLAGFFANGIKPTGSKDPFALRRAALGVVRIVLENQLRLPLRAILIPALAPFASAQRSREANSEILDFFADRLKVYLREQGIRHDLIAATFAVGVGGEEDDLVRLVARAEALQRFLGGEDGRNLLAAYHRATNIVAIAEKKEGRAYNRQPVADALAEPAEKALFAALGEARGRIDTALAAEDFGGAMAALASLRVPIDTFFDQVLVNAPEPELRVNRLLMLGQIRAGLHRVADFSLVEDVGRTGGG